ncbi:hypothetical protein Tco_1502669 [Tanacetum coccineum]
MNRSFVGEHIPLLPAMLAGATPNQSEGSAIPACSQPTPDPVPPTTSQPQIIEPQPSSSPRSIHWQGATTTTTSLDVGLDNVNIHESPLRSHEAPLPEGHTSESAEDSLQLKELMAIIPKLDEETENQERKVQDIDNDPLVSLGRDFMEEKEAHFVTPIKVSALGEAQEEDISPTIFEAAKTLSKVASQSVSTYKRRARSADKGKDIGTGLDFLSAAKEKLNSAEVEVNTSRVEVNPGSAEVNTSSTPISTPSVVQTVNVTIPSPVKGQREGKAPMTADDKRKDGVQEVAQYYTKEDWDIIRAKLEANVELTKSLQGENVPSDDFAKRMVDMINQKKKYYAEQKAKAKRDKPMTQAQQRDYMCTFIKNQSSWKMAQLKKLTFEELKSSTKQKTVGIKDVPVTEEKVDVEKKEEPIKRTGKRKKQIARKGTVIQPMLKDISRDNLTELYKLVMQKYGTNRLEEEYERVFWGDLKTMFDPPLTDIYMLSERKYPIPADACQAMLDKKLQGGKEDEACYQFYGAEEMRIIDTTQAQQKALDDALVALDNRLNIRNCNLRLSSTLKSKEPTLQVVLDALKLTPFFKAFEITADICPKFPGQKFKDPPFEEEILSFIRDLGHTREIKVLTNVNVNHMHQPWISFAAIINKCLSGKTTALESLRLSRAQILWGMYHNKHVDYVYLLWEDLVYQVENKNSKKNNDMYYPRFTKVIVDYFMTKDPSIPRRNKMFWHTARDDSMFTTIRVISKHQDTQIYGAILPRHLTNQDMIESEAYKTYYAYATGEKTQKPKYMKKKVDSDRTPKKKIRYYISI